MTLTRLHSTIRRREGRPFSIAPRRLGHFAAAFVLLAAAPALLVGCGGGDEREALNTSSRRNPLGSMFKTTVTIGDPAAPASAQYDCWVASRPSQRDEEFSYILPSELPPGRALIAIYPEDRPVAFNGRNTFVGVEVVFAEFVEEGIGRITNFGAIGAFQREPASSVKPVKYVLFVQGGDLARSGAKVGDLIFVPVATPTQ